MDLFEKYSLPEIPAKCITCPGLQAMLDHIEVHDGQTEKLNELANFAMDGPPPEVKTMLLDFMSASETEVEEMMDQGAVTLRQAVASGMYRNDEHIAKERYEMTQYIANCAGKLTLRALRDKMEYTVSLCGSRMQTPEDNPISATLRLRPLSDD